MATLFIIGNGFDKHHKLNTEYKDYRKFLNDNKKCKGILEKYKEEDRFWANIEKGLKIDYEAYIKKYIDIYNYQSPLPGMVANQDKGKKREIDEYEEFFRDLQSFTGIYFYKWLKQCYSQKIKESQKSQIVERLISKSDYFISFNYTSTLEDLYDIDDEHILHIHGQLKNVNDNELYLAHITCRNECIIEERHGIIRSEMQFGNPDNRPEKMRLFIDSMKIEENNRVFSIEALKDKLESIMMHSQKCINQNLEILRKKLKDWKGIEKIIIMGCSLEAIDAAYFNEVLCPKYKDIIWEVYYHGNKKNAEKLIKDNGLYGHLHQW